MYVVEFYIERDKQYNSIVLEREVRIGRSGDNDVVLPDRSVSRYHAAFAIETSPLDGGQSVVLRDEGSTNGVIVNGQPVDSRTLVRPGDQIQIGVFGIVLVEEEDVVPEPILDDEQDEDFGEQTMCVSPEEESKWDSIPLERMRELCDFATTELPDDTDALLERLRQKIEESIDFETLTIFFINHLQEPTIRSWSVRDPKAGEVGERTRQLRGTIVERATSSLRVVVTRKEAPESLLEVPDALDIKFNAACACVPISNNSVEHFGAIYLESGPDLHFTSEDLQFLSVVARIVGSATERRRSHEEILRAKNIAERANHAKNEFLANMSHEIRTPLHGVLSFAGFGIKKHKTAAAEKVLGYFERIQESAKGLQEILFDVLELATLESGKHEFHFAVINLSALAQDVVSSFAKEAEAKGQTVALEIPSEPVESSIDHEKVKQMIENILSNAIQFSPEGGRVEVVVDATEDEVGVAIRDTGPGIPDEEFETIFESFVQSSLTNTGAGGTGLGLAICRQIADAHGGEIHARNREEGGAEVSFRLPKTLCREDPETHRVDTTEAATEPTM